MLSLKDLECINAVLNIHRDQGDYILEVADKIDKLIKEANETKECLWKFCWNCGRQGKVEGIFKATKDDVKDAIGEEVNFGEILGKHSEVYGVIEEGEINLVSDDPIVVVNSKESGYNPLDYLRRECPVCNNSYSPDEWDFEKKMCICCVED
jgi:hypothetical protein